MAGLVQWLQQRLLGDKCLYCGKSYTAKVLHTTAAFCLRSNHLGVACTTNVHAILGISARYGLERLHSKLLHGCIRTNTTKCLILPTTTYCNNCIPKSLTFAYSISSSISWNGCSCNTSSRCCLGCRGCHSRAKARVECHFHSNRSWW